MKIQLIQVGKTTFDFVAEGERMYRQRIQKQAAFEVVVQPQVKKSKKLSERELKRIEGKAILDKISTSAFLVLLDERGREMTSREFAAMLDNHRIRATKELVFVIGGAYGFSDEVYARANQKMALSKMTFSHQIVRLLFLEQVYRALSILEGSPYHHD